MPIPIPASIQPFWDEYCAAAGGEPSALFYEAFHFTDNELGANELAQLVLAGTKRATAGLVWSFEAGNESPPKPGALSVVTDWQGTPLCVIETLSVEIAPFNEVTEEFAATEGEGDGSLHYWREGHWDFFGRECQRLGREPRLDMPVVCERFKVVYRRSG